MDATIDQPSDFTSGPPLSPVPSHLHLLLRQLTVGRCRGILFALLAIGFLSHLRYLTHNCPIDLAGDEAQYWDWSRQLELSYYSKGPLVAYIIRASCNIFGETMFAVRFPALLLGVGTSILTYILTARLFKSERIALGAVALYYIVPMFVAGSVLMTIDSPFFFCWAMATLLAAIALFKDRKWPWPVIGVFVGIGFLAKYAMSLWFVGLFVFMVIDPGSRKRLIKTGPWLAVVIAMLFTIPVIVWNHQHGWVSLKHVAHQTGASEGHFSGGNLIEFIGSQLAILGLISIFGIGAIVSATQQSPDSMFARERRFLLVIGLTFFAFVMLSSLFAKAQPNWPAPAYFTLLILTAHFIGTRISELKKWKRWRGWFYATVVLGLILSPLLHDNSVLFPVIEGINPPRVKEGNFEAIDKSRKLEWLTPADVDFMAKLRGWKLLGERIGSERETLNDSAAFILCDDYMQTAEAAFYTPGQPKTYYAGSYFLKDPKRLTQYDMWPDRSLENNPALMGHNAIYVGKGGRLPGDVSDAFKHVEPLPEVPVIVRGSTVKSLKLWKCYGFKGMRHSAKTESF